MSKTIPDKEKLIKAIRDRYFLDWHGIHGWNHWMKVHETALVLAEENGADLRVVELFALLHDSCRLSDGHDPEHGPRAAGFASRLQGTCFILDEKGLDLLLTAIRDHTRGYVHPDPTIRVCWDADRLDLPRVGTVPDPRYFGTETAKRMLTGGTSSSTRKVR